MTQVFNETRGSGFYVVSEVGDGHRAREQVVMGIAPAAIEVGTVLGKTVVAGTAVASAVTGTGTGTITVDGTAPVGTKAKVGVYKFECIGAKTNGGSFAVTDPDGKALEPAFVGVTYDTPHLKLLIADATDFVVGDSFTVTVAAAAHAYYYPLSLTDHTGKQTVAGILWNRVAISTAIQNAVATVRESEVLGEELVYPVGATDNDKAAINASLLALGIIVRDTN